MTLDSSCPAISNQGKYVTFRSFLNFHNVLEPHRFQPRNPSCLSGGKNQSIRFRMPPVRCLLASLSFGMSMILKEGTRTSCPALFDVYPTRIPGTANRAVALKASDLQGGRVFAHRPAPIQRSSCLRYFHVSRCTILSLGSTCAAFFPSRGGRGGVRMAMMSRTESHVLPFWMRVASIRGRPPTNQDLKNRECGEPP